MPAIGTAELSRIFNDLKSALGDYPNTSPLVVRSPQIAMVFAEVGEKVDGKWMASSQALFEFFETRFDSSQTRESEYHLSIGALSSGKSVLSVTPSDSEVEQVTDEIKLHLRASLLEDKKSAKELRKRRKRRRLHREESVENARKENERKRAIFLPHQDRIRRQIKETVKLLHARDKTWVGKPLRSEPYPNEDPVGSVFLEVFKYFFADREVPGRRMVVGRHERTNLLFARISYETGLSTNELQSRFGKTINVRDCGFCLRIIQAYHMHKTEMGLEKHDIRHATSAEMASSCGNFPGTSMLNNLLRTVKSQVSPLLRSSAALLANIAPIEDLFDYIAIKFYAGKHAGLGADGAIGYLVGELAAHQEEKGEKLSLKDLAGELEYWTEARLKECYLTWYEEVSCYVLERPLKEMRVPKYF
ncbi:MAG: hypothetical protein HOI23_00960 [Deltaproteobacteria bacterium]|nr:hypothetical protein [Deltaproteobacteria bacterium]